MADKKRVVVTGMGIKVPIGDDTETYFENLMAGRTAIIKWKYTDVSRVYSKGGGDLSGYDVAAKIKSLEALLPAAIFKKMRKLVKKAPFSTKLSILCSLDAYIDAKMDDTVDPDRVAVIIGGHNLNKYYQHTNYLTFLEEPDYIDPLASLSSLDSDHAGCVGEVWGAHGPIYTVGGACASANIAMRHALDELNYHDCDIVVIVGAALEFAPVDLHGALVFETLESALKRGANIHAEVLGIEAMSDGNHLPSPSVEGQTRTMRRVLKNSDVRPEEIDYVNAHATSTPLGDLTEIESIKNVFGDHAKRLKINAPKSMLGHTCWSAPAVETVAGILQMQRNRLHPSVNIENMDPAVDLDVCANEPRELEIKTFLKNSFGFGGINCCAIYRKWDPGSV
jgi:3-oxoacyl-(acyl-carrier-protein) synthase